MRDFTQYFPSALQTLYPKFPGKQPRTKLASRLLFIRMKQGDTQKGKRGFMNYGKKYFSKGALLMTLLGSFCIPLLAERPGTVRVGNKGEITFSSPVRVGEVLLQPGLYQLQHKSVGESHSIIFKPIVERRHAGWEKPTDKEITRLKCHVQPLEIKAKATEVRFGTNPAKETTIEEVMIQGENVKHVF
ncbi:MAG TPA: hypothetical protein VGK99_09460 [Acidobacteriota bacterium]|jgi:hypothetical protein